MKPLKRAALCAALALGALPSIAAPISATNGDRPNGGLLIGSTSDTQSPCQIDAATAVANCQLQTIFNAIAPGINVNTDQLNYGLFSIAGGGMTQATAPVLKVELTSNNATQQFGMWFDKDGDSATTGDRVLAPLFDGSAAPGDPVLVTFNIAGQFVKVNGVTYNNFGNSGFGFYLQPTGPNGQTWYSVDALNADGATQFLAYNEPAPNRWYFAFEDIKRNAACSQVRGFGGDCDHNDMIVSIESIQGGRIPEPATMSLVGLALAVFGFTSRRRRG